MFDTLRYAKLLQEVGFSKDQSERSVEILLEVMENKLATKEDLWEMKEELRDELRGEISASANSLEQKFDQKLIN